MNYDEAFEQFKQYNFNEKTFCPHPFISFYPSPRGDVFPCCVAMTYNAPAKVRQDNDLDKMMNTEAFKKMRRKMIAGKRPVECRDCWIREDSGIKSDRQTINGRFESPKRSQVLYDSVNDTLPDGTIPDFKIKYLEFRDNNICNYKCRFCNLNSSSSWISDWTDMGRLDVGPPNVNLKTGVAESGVDWTQIDFSYLTDIHMAGGEPTAMDSTFWLLKHLVEIDRAKHIEIGIVSNTSKLARKKQDILELLSHFKYVNWSCSIDGLGKVHDYLRAGGKDDFEEVDANIWRVYNWVKADSENRSMKFHSTMNWNNAFAWHDVFLRYSVLDVGIFFSTGPEGTGINELPNEYIDRIIEFYENVKKTTDPDKMAQIDRVLAFCRNNKYEGKQEDDKRWRALSYYKDEQIFLDAKRNQSFLETFPEWEDLWLKIPATESNYSGMETVIESHVKANPGMYFSEKN